MTNKLSGPSPTVLQGIELSENCIKMDVAIESSLSENPITDYVRELVTTRPYRRLYGLA